MDRKKIVVAGGSGQIGSLLVRHWQEQGHEVVQFSRTAGSGRVVWDAKTHGEWARSLEGADALVNLCGSDVLKRWTDESFREIEESRVLSTGALGQAVALCKSPPKFWINASAIGYYGDSGNREVSEATRAGNDKLGQLCKKWEAACLDSRTPETRKVCLRIGVVLEPRFKIVKLLSTAAKFGACAPLGSGNQFMSWIHWEDLIAMVDWCLAQDVHGAVNACTPEAVTNREMAATMRGLYCRPALPAVPAPLVSFVASLMGMEPSMLLSGQRAYPEIALARGFKFKHTNLEDALSDVLGIVPKAWQPA